MEWGWNEVCMAWWWKLQCRGRWSGSCSDKLGECQPLLLVQDIEDGGRRKNSIQSADREAMNLRKRSDFRQDKEVTALLQGKVSYVRQFLCISMGLLVKKLELYFLGYWEPPEFYAGDWHDEIWILESSPWQHGQYGGAREWSAEVPLEENNS